MANDKEKKEFKDTAVGKFIKNNVPDALELLSKTNIPIVSQIAGTINAIGLPKEKEAEFHEALADYEQNELPLLLADTKDARAREIAITTSENAPLISKIVQPILAIIIITLTFTMWYMVLYKEFKNDNKDIIVFVLGSLSTLTASIVGYYFGSSSSSAQKQKTLDKMFAEK